MSFYFEREREKACSNWSVFSSEKKWHISGVQFLFWGCRRIALQFGSQICLSIEYYFGSILKQWNLLDLTLFSEILSFLVRKLSCYFTEDLNTLWRVYKSEVSFTIVYSTCLFVLLFWKMITKKVVYGNRCYENCS